MANWSPLGTEVPLPGMPECSTQTSAIAPPPALNPTPAAVAAFARKLVKAPGSGCWYWTGSISKPDGYGRITWQHHGVTRTLSAHRFALLVSGIVVGDEEIAEHECNEPLCVRVGDGHLRVTTQAENIQSARDRGRHKGRQLVVDSRQRYARSLRIRAALLHGWDANAVATALQYGADGEQLLNRLISLIPIEDTSPVGAPVFAVIDVETTGLDADRCRIVEIGIVRLDKHFREVDRWETLINSGLRSIAGQQIHHINKAMLADAPSFAGIHDELNHRLHGMVILAHNAKFDVSFINAEAKRLYRRTPASKQLFLENVIDTLDLAKQVIPKGSHSLDALLRRFRIRNECAHSAGADAAATGKLLTKLFGLRKMTVSRKLRSQRAEHNAALRPTIGDAQPPLPRKDV